MTIEEMMSFRTFVNEFLRLIKPEEKLINSSSVNRREKASKTLEFMLPKLRSMVQFYVKKFCNEKTLITNNAFRTGIRIDILQKAREHVSIPIPKTYAKMLKTTKE